MGYPKKVFLNGKITDASEARISVFDRGFIFGDGIYEVMARINQNFFYKQAHLERMQNGLQQIGIAFDVHALEHHIPELLIASELKSEDCLLYIQVTRGEASRQHAYPKDIRPTAMMYAWPKALPDINQIHAHTVTLEDFRWKRCDIKMTSLLGNVMANEYAMEHEAYETLLVRDGVITEASHCNIFFVKDNTVYTHPANHLILNGITRIAVLDLCNELGVKVKEEGISLHDLASMDEAFLTGTSTQIASIRTINEHAFYEGDARGPITKRLQEAFMHIKQQISTE